MTENNKTSELYGVGAGPGDIELITLKGFRILQQADVVLYDNLANKEVENKSNCLPWVHLACFAGKVLERMISQYKTATTERITFFDRGVVDIIAYLKVAGIPVAPAYFTAAENYHYSNAVFILPPWRDIYVNDGERWQTFTEAEETYSAIFETHQSLGYKLIELSKSTLNERLIFVLDNMESVQNDLGY